ncbi:MAG TPA: hypothetical protein VMK31_02300 [Sphingomicrobium sp.]|nr:hypothetical protein [Sphingomicrobium sp.]
MRAAFAAGMAALLASGLISGCGEQAEEDRRPTQSIQVRGAEQDRLHQLNDLNRDIAMKRAIRDSGFRCQRVTSSGYVARYENLDMWTAACADARQWAVFVGADGSAQVRDCEDVVEFGLPGCEIRQEQPGTGDG